jgi:hypothetical protein
MPLNYTSGCGIQSRPGGIKRIWIINCSYEFGDIGDRNEWETAISNGDIVGSGLILGQKAKGSFTKKRIASCQPEGVVGAEKQITFQDYNHSGTLQGNCLVYNFWNTLLTTPSNYQLAYETCDGYVYGVITDFQIEIDEVIEDNNTGSTYFDGTILWNDIEMICPVAVNLSGL